MALNEADKEMAKRTLRQYCSSWEEFRYDEMHNKPYFIGKREKSCRTEILCPINCYSALTFEELKSSILDSGSTSVNMAVYNTDSTVVLYKAELGLKPPIFAKENKSDSFSNESKTLQQTGSLLEEPNVMQPQCSSNKRKIDVVLDSPTPGQSETDSTADCFQIDLHSPDDSDQSLSNQAC